MNKFQEALTTLRVLEREYNFKNQSQISPQINCDILQEIVDKTIPKRPTYEGDGYVGYNANGELIYDTWYCPCCDKRYEVDYDNYDYCPSCGQAIDWSDEGKGERNEK